MDGGRHVCLICVTCWGWGGGRHLPSGLWGTPPSSPGPWLPQCSQPQRTQLLPDAMPAPWFSQPLEQGGVWGKGFSARAPARSPHSVPEPSLSRGNPTQKPQEPPCPSPTPKQQCWYLRSLLVPLPLWSCFLWGRRTRGTEIPT